MKKVALNQLGDTIIEVLLAIAVASAVLGGAYVASNRSLSASRQAQERGEALKFTEAQVERLKVVATDPTSGVFDTAVNPHFCLNGTSVISMPGLNVDDLSAYPPECGFGDDDRYKIAITLDGSDTFMVTTKWDRFGGGDTPEELPMAYRVYQ